MLAPLRTRVTAHHVRPFDGVLELEAQTKVNIPTASLREETFESIETVAQMLEELRGMYFDRGGGGSFPGGDGSLPPGGVGSLPGGVGSCAWPVRASPPTASNVQRAKTLARQSNLRMLTSRATAFESQIP